jgi:hypothetical protein
MTLSPLTTDALVDVLPSQYHRLSIRHILALPS